MDQRHHGCFQLHLHHSPSVSDYTEMSGASFAAKCTCRFDAAPCALPVNRPENERIRLIPRKFHHWKFRHSGLPSGNTPFGNTIRFLYSSSRPTFNPLCNRTKHVYFCNLVEILRGKNIL